MKTKGIITFLMFFIVLSISAQDFNEDFKVMQEIYNGKSYYLKFRITHSFFMNNKDSIVTTEGENFKVRDVYYEAVGDNKVFVDDEIMIRINDSSKRIEIYPSSSYPKKEMGNPGFSNLNTTNDSVVFSGELNGEKKYKIFSKTNRVKFYEITIDSEGDLKESIINYNNKGEGLKQIKMEVLSKKKKLNKDDFSIKKGSFIKLKYNNYQQVGDYITYQLFNKIN